MERQIRQIQGGKSIYSCCSVSSSVAANLKVSSSQVQDGVASKSQNGLQGTAARRSSFWRCSTANPPQRNAARRILEWIWICSASASPKSGMHQSALKLEEISLPMQWGQVVEYTGHPHRARARMPKKKLVPLVSSNPRWYPHSWAVAIRSSASHTVLRHVEEQATHLVVRSLRDARRVSCQWRSSALSSWMLSN